MSRKAELVERLRTMAGSPSELAAAVGVEASDATFRRAVEELTAEGVLVPAGSTRDRRYLNAVAPPVPWWVTQGVRREDAYARMGAVASRQKDPIGAGKESR